MITEKMLDHLRQDVREYMGEKRYLHTLGVEKEMRFLAGYFMPKREGEAAAAGLLHDVTKEWAAEKQIAYCKENRLAISEEERFAPSLLHAKTGAHYAKAVFAPYVTVSSVRAISRHTVGAKTMRTMDAMLYLADYTEENRRYPKCRALREKVHRLLPECPKEGRRALLYSFLLEAYDNTLSSLIEMNSVISPVTLAARNRLLAKGVRYDK